MTEPREDGQLIPKAVGDAARAEGEEAVTYQAYKLRRAGYSWPVIAQQLGYANANSACVAVRNYLQRAAVELDVEARREALTLELDRLDALLASYYANALAGDIKAAELVLKISVQRSRLHAFEELYAKDQRETTRTIVVPVERGQYAETLREITEGKP